MRETVAVVNICPGLGDSVVAFWAEAAHQQAIECAKAWGIEPTPVIFVSDTKDLPDDCCVLAIRSDIDTPGALGYHDVIGGRSFYEIKYTGDATSVTISHEVLEGMVDPMCGRWAPFDPDHEQAVEIADRVEGDTYYQDAIVMGELRKVSVSNFLLPSAFDPVGTAPFDRLGLLSGRNAMTSGGYVIVRNITTGKVGDVFASCGPNASANIIEKLANSGSRLSRRLNV